MFSMKSIKKRILGFSNNQEGFTLIEIIAVLVILGILAAVAVPRFTNLQADARNSAAQAGVAEGKARCTVAYAHQLLAANGNTLAVTGTSVALETLDEASGGDFAFTDAQGGAGVVVTVTEVQGQTVSVTGEWEMP